MIPQIDGLLARLDTCKEDVDGYVGGGYWDDFCLGMFLKGVCMRYVAYPVRVFFFFLFSFFSFFFLTSEIY